MRIYVYCINYGIFKGTEQKYQIYLTTNKHPEHIHALLPVIDISKIKKNFSPIENQVLLKQKL